MFRAQSAHHQEVNDANCICFVDLVMMSGLRSKHVEEFNLCEWTRNLCIKLVIIKKLYYDARLTKYQNLHC